MIVWTNGCFDIIHIGHIELFKYARSLGSKLFVGIDSDRRIKINKGDSRPINNELNRKAVLSSIKHIDDIFIFNSDDELRSTIKNLGVDIIVVGDDYKDKLVIGSDLVKQTLFFSKIPNISTSKIIASYNE